MDLSIALADFLQSLACNGVGKGATMMGVGWDTQDNKQFEALRKSIGSKDIPGWKIYRIYPTVAISEYMFQSIIAGTNVNILFRVSYGNFWNALFGKVLGPLDA